MTASVSFLSLVILLAVSMTAVSTVVLLVLWFKDRKRKQLW
jgi:hypothetical protein